LSFATRNAAAGSPSAEPDSAFATKVIVKAGARRVDVDQTCAAGSRVPERVLDAGRRGDERAGAETNLLAVQQKVGLALGDIERVDVAFVRVRLRPFETGVELKLDERKLVPPSLDRRDALVFLEPLTLARRKKDCVDRWRTAAGVGVVAVEAAGLAAVTSAQVLRKAAVRRMEVEEASARRAPEAVDDVRRSADERSRLDHLLIVADENSELALEDVERVRMQLVEVRLSSLARVRKQRLRDAELVEGCLEHDPPAEERFALAGAQKDSVHLQRV
jgi:hypothetical protein